MVRAMRQRVMRQQSSHLAPRDELGTPHKLMVLKFDLLS
jgi:hypothetical protein